MAWPRRQPDPMPNSVRPMVWVAGPPDTLPQRNATLVGRNIRLNRKLRESDGKALPNNLGQMLMSFFQPPPSTPLEPYQLVFLESIFKQAWSQIVPRHSPLSPDLRQHLQAEISSRLCSFVMRGVTEPSVLLGLTVATVKSPRRKVRRRVMLGRPHPVAG